MSITESILQIEQQLKVHNDIVTNAAEIILDNEVTKYPIFIATQQEVELGINVINHETTTAAWSVYASSLEELVSKQIIASDKIDEFRKTYKDPREFNCYFVISSLGTQIAFLPSTSK